MGDRMPGSPASSPSINAKGHWCVAIGGICAIEWHWESYRNQSSGGLWDIEGACSCFGFASQWASSDGGQLCGVRSPELWAPPTDIILASGFTSSSVPEMQGEPLVAASLGPFAHPTYLLSIRQRKILDLCVQPLPQVEAQVDPHWNHWLIW